MQAGHVSALRPRRARAALGRRAGRCLGPPVSAGASAKRRPLPSLQRSSVSPSHPLPPKPPLAVELSPKFLLAAEPQSEALQVTALPLMPSAPPAEPPVKSRQAAPVSAQVFRVATRAPALLASPDQSAAGSVFPAYASIEHTAVLEQDVLNLIVVMCSRLRDLGVVDVGVVAARTMERLDIMSGANSFVLADITVAGSDDVPVVRFAVNLRLRQENSQRLEVSVDPSCCSFRAIA